jgi:hypothetical protein
VNVSGCGLNQSSVDGLGEKCNPSIAGSFDSSGGTNAAPIGGWVAELQFTPLTISGAGNPFVDGQYYPGATVNGRNSYTNGYATIYWAGWGGWIITDEVDSYYSTEDVAEPWLVVTWATDGGWDAPAPTLTAPSDGLWSVTTN